MTDPLFSAVIPAAGLSSRMERFKPMLPLGKGTVIERVVSLFSDLSPERVHVVVGHGQERLVPILERTGVRIVINPAFRDGMFSSITSGLRQVDPASDAVFLLPADIPLVRPASIRRLMQVYAFNNGKIIHPVFRSQNGHPPLIPAALIPQILTWREPGGLKEFLEHNAQLTAQVPLADHHILFDIDTPANYKELTSRWQSYHIPTTEECETILNDIHPVSGRTLRHGRMVARIAEKIGKALIEVGIGLEPGLIHAGALLHDIAKGQKDHAERGEQMIADLGFARVSRIVGAHTNLVPDPHGRIGETEVVFMADKVVRGDEVIPIAQRFAEPLDRWADDPSAVAIILKRRDIAYHVKQRIEELIGRSIESVIGHAPTTD